MHNAREGSARNELYLYLVHRYEYRGTICRPGPHRLCGRRKLYRSVGVGLSMLRGGVLRPRRELGKTRRTMGRERKTVRWEIALMMTLGWATGTGNTYAYSVKEPRSQRERYMRVAPMDLR